MTGVVVVTVIMFSLLIGGADYGLGYAVKPIYSNTSGGSSTTTTAPATTTTTATPSAAPSASASASASPST